MLAVSSNLSNISQSTSYEIVARVLSKFNCYCDFGEVHKRIVTVSLVECTEKSTLL